MTLTDDVKRMIESIRITSAGGNNPVENMVLSIGETPDLDAAISSGETDSIKNDKRTQEAVKKLESFDKGKIGEINRFTSSQMGNLRGFVSNPVQFMIQTVFKKFARGVGVAAFALIIFEAVKFIISELLKPGRFLDLRFKRDINKEIIAFRQREDQQKLKQGFSNIIITTQSRLRGGQGQIFNTLDAVAGRTKFPDNIGQSSISVLAAGVSLSKSTGKRSFGGPGR